MEHFAPSQIFFVCNLYQWLKVLNVTHINPATNLWEHLSVTASWISGSTYMAMLSYWALVSHVNNHYFFLSTLRSKMAHRFVVHLMLKKSWKFHEDILKIDRNNWVGRLTIFGNCALQIQIIWIINVNN